MATYASSHHHIKIQNQSPTTTTTTLTTTTTTAKPKRRKYRDNIQSNTSHEPPMSLSYSPNSNSHFTSFNSALTAGLLNPIMSSPPPLTKSSPTLFDMIVNEPDRRAKDVAPPPPAKETTSHCRMQQRVAEILENKSPGSMFNDSATSDMLLTLRQKDGFSVAVRVHRQILAANSAFFAARLGGGAPFEVEIADCDDVEVYVEALRLMYCRGVSLRRMLMKEDVNKVLAILKISATIGFDAGVFSCLEYLEAAPWAEDEEERITFLLSDLRLENFGAGEVLKRVFTSDNEKGTEEVLRKLLQVVIEGKDEKARREIKGVFLKMLRESADHNDISKESLYSACEGCLQQLRHGFLQAASSDLRDVSQIARQADNLHWLLDILIDRQIAEEFVKTWGSQTEISNVHSKVPSVHRFEVSRVTARLFVGIGKGQLLASKDSRCLLLKTWLVPFYDDFGWMRRASQGLDRNLIEDGLCNTILTLPLSWQQDILLAWFDRFLNSGEDCPNIQRGFEVWWKRAFWKRNGERNKSCVRITNGENP